MICVNLNWLIYGLGGILQLCEILWVYTEFWVQDVFEPSSPIYTQHLEVGICRVQTKIQFVISLLPPFIFANTPVKEQQLKPKIILEKGKGSGALKSPLSIFLWTFYWEIDWWFDYLINQLIDSWFDWLIDWLLCQVPGMQDFSWSPKENILAYWVAEDKVNLSIRQKQQE